MEERKYQELRNNWSIYLYGQLAIINYQFDWIKLWIEGKFLKGDGCIKVDGIKYCINIIYSPFLPFRMDRIFIGNHNIVYNDEIHVYKDLSLCLYHTRIDKPFLGFIHLYSMIPWITEWCHFYNQYKKYGVWLGKEIKHTAI